MAGWFVGVIGWRSPFVSCGDFYTGAGAHVLDLSHCDVQAGDLLFIGAGQVKTGGTPQGGNVIVVNNPGAVSLYEKFVNLFSNRTGCQRLYTMTAGPTTKADGISFTISDGTASGAGRIDVFVLRGWALDAHVISGALGGAVSVGPLSGANFIVGLETQNASGSGGHAEIAGQESLAGDSRHRLFASDGTAVTVQSSGPGVVSAAMVRLI